MAHPHPGNPKKKTGILDSCNRLFLSIAWFAIVAIFDVFNLFPWYLTTTQTVLAVVTDLSSALTLALQFAWEFGSANRDLRRAVGTCK